MNNIELFKDENSNKLLQKLDNLTINLGEDNQDVLNIDSSVYVNNIERHIPDEFKTTDKNKYLIVDTNNNYKYVDLNLDNSKFRFHKICSEKGNYDTSANSSGDVTPTDGDIHLKMNETMIIFLNFSAYTNTTGVVTWTFKYRIKGTDTYLAFDYPELGQFKHYYNATADHQHRSGQIVFSSSSQDIIIDSFDVDFTDGVIDHNDFLSMNALIIPNNYLKSYVIENSFNLLIYKTDINYQDQTKLLLSYPFKRGVDGNDGQRNYGSINNSDMTIDFVYHSFNQYEGFTIRNDQTPFNNISFRKTSGNFNNSGDDFTLYLRWRKTGSVPGENYARLISAWNGTSTTTRLQVNFEENVNDVVGEPNNNLRLWFGDTGTSHVEIAATVTLDRWYNLIVVLDNTNSEAKVYMDNTTQGILEYIGSLDRSSVSNYVFNNISLGRYRYDNSSYEFDGDFSDFYLFNDKLTIQQSQDWVNYVLNDYKSNNAGSELITNGDSEIWNKPTTNNLIGIDNDSAYNAVTVNKDNTALTCMSNNEVIQLPAGTTSQRPNITKNGQIRYNTTTSCYEIYKQNSWKKIITSDISINTQVNMEVTDSSYYNQMPAPYSASICLLHRDFVGDEIYDDESPFTSYGAYVNIQQKEYAPDYSEYFNSNMWYENSFDTIIYDSSPEHNMAYVRKFQPGDNPRDTANDSDTWNGGGIVIRKSGTYILYYSSSISHIDGTFSTAFYKNDTNISQQTGTTTKTINGISHNFIDKNYTVYLQEGDLIRIRSHHTRSLHTTWSKDNMINYDYNDPTNSYNYDYMLNIASKLTVRLLDSTSLDSGGDGGGY